MGLFSLTNKQDIDRVARILDVLAKYQMASFADRIRIGEKIRVRLPRNRPSKEILYKTPPERVRMALEELGTTFVKFGQLLSTREDIVGADYAEELSKLQDHMKPFSSEEAKREVEDELQKPILEIFSSFDKDPFASASIAQVHRAKLKNGKKSSAQNSETRNRHDSQGGHKDNALPRPHGEQVRAGGAQVRSDVPA